MMMPFLSSGKGSCHARDIVVTSVETAVNDCGAPEGTADNHYFLKAHTKLTNNIILVLQAYHLVVL